MLETTSAAAGRAAGARPAGLLAPWSIHALSRAISSAERGEPSLSGGIRQPSRPVTASTIRLSSLCAGLDRRTAVAALLHEGGRIQPQPGLVLQGPVAGVTPLAQDRLDIANVIDRERAGLIAAADAG